MKVQYRYIYPISQHYFKRFMAYTHHMLLSLNKIKCSLYCATYCQLPNPSLGAAMTERRSDQDIKIRSNQEQKQSSHINQTFKIVMPYTILKQLEKMVATYKQINILYQGHCTQQPGSINNQPLPPPTFSQSILHLYLKNLKIQIPVTISHFGVEVSHSK